LQLRRRYYELRLLRSLGVVIGYALFVGILAIVRIGERQGIEKERRKE